MKYTLLELTQSVLRSIKGEAVNSISDTQESSDVADIIKECYYTIVSSLDLPETKTVFELLASGDNAKPTLMSMPDAGYSVEWVKYDVQTLDDTEPNYRDIKFIPLEDFLDYTNQFNTTEDNVSSMTITVDGNTLSVKYRSDTAPTYCCSLNDSTILFDSYDSEVDTTLQKTKSQAYGIYLTDWDNDDAFVPNLDAHQFALLLKEAKAMAWQELKSVENVAAQRSARRLMVTAQNKRDRVNNKHMGYYYTQYPNYGRK